MIAVGKVDLWVYFSIVRQRRNRQRLPQQNLMVALIIRVNPVGIKNAAEPVYWVLLRNCTKS